RKLNILYSEIQLGKRGSTGKSRSRKISIIVQKVAARFDRSICQTRNSDGGVWHQDAKQIGEVGIGECSFDCSRKSLACQIDLCRDDLRLPKNAARERDVQLLVFSSAD